MRKKIQKNTKKKQEMLLTILAHIARFSARIVDSRLTFLARTVN